MSPLPPSQLIFIYSHAPLDLALNNPSVALILTLIHSRPRAPQPQNSFCGQYPLTYAFDSGCVVSCIGSISYPRDLYNFVYNQEPYRNGFQFNRWPPYKPQCCPATLATIGAWEHEAYTELLVQRVGRTESPTIPTSTEILAPPKFPTKPANLPSRSLSWTVYACFPRSS